MKLTTTLSLRAATLLLGTPVIAGCQHIHRIDVAQITYEMLRAEDCRRNELETFCERTYASEYYDYVRMRKDFMRSEQQSPLPVVRLESTDALDVAQGS